MGEQADFVQVNAQLDALCQWFGEARLRAAQAPLRAGDLSPLEFTRRLQKQWVVRDLITYLGAREAGALSEALVFHQLMPLGRLASAILRFDRDGATPVPDRFKQLLLTEACADYAHEILSAAHHDWRGFHVRWLPEGQLGGEFAARIPGSQEIYVECKRLAPDAVEMLKTDEVALIAESLDTALDLGGWSGTVRLDIGGRHLGRPSLLEVVARLSTGLAIGQGMHEIEDIKLRYDLHPADRQRPYADVLDLMNSRDPVHRVITGRREGGTILRPRVFELSGPKRTGDWFARKIETIVVEQAADRQLSPDAPGVVCLELPMFRNVEPDEALAIAEDVVVMLFERLHIVGFFAVLDLATEVQDGYARANARGLVVSNDASRFAQARATWNDRMNPVDG